MTLHPADHDFAVIEHIVERDIDPDLIALARARVAALLLLGPRPMDPVSTGDRVIADFVDQFVVDVSGIDDALRAAFFDQLEGSAIAFGQALYVIDLGIRRKAVLERLGLPLPAGDIVSTDLELWPALEQYMRTVAKMKALDPVTSELVRVRGAAAHHCRICSSRLSVQAIEDYGSDTPFVAVLSQQPADLSDRHAAALSFVDAVITQPTELTPERVAVLRSHFSDAELHELLHDVVRNSTNKFAVAVGGDAAIVNEGFEYYDIDPSGDVVADVDPDIVRAATRV